MITKDFDNRLTERNHLACRDKPNGRTDGREGVRSGWRYSHAATCVRVESNKFFVLNNCDKPKIVSQDINAVIVRKSKSDLELARQIAPTVERFFTVR